MEAKFTKGPWEANGLSIDAGSTHIAYVDTSDNNAGLGDGEGEANAHRIVQCVNAHDALLGALERIFDEAHVDGQRDRGPRRMSPGLRAAIDASRAAIAKALGA